MQTATTLNGQELELFRIGNYGDKGTYTAADMQDLVATFAAAGEVPVTIGHPVKDDEPAYAWLKTVRFSGDTLYGTLGDVSPELDKLVGADKSIAPKYKHRSVGFFPRNQVGGKTRLRHLAYLGAVPRTFKGSSQQISAAKSTTRSNSTRATKWTSSRSISRSKPESAHFSRVSWAKSSPSPSTRIS